jgi:hypothetical protein
MVGDWNEIASGRKHPWFHEIGKHIVARYAEILMNQFVAKHIEMYV